MAIRSLIRYPGGKGKAFDFLVDHFPDGIKDWREPFFGGGSVTIGFLQHPKSKDCERFVVGDLYTEVYSFWKGVKDNPDGVVNATHEYLKEYMPRLTEASQLWQIYHDRDMDIVAETIADGFKFWDYSKAVDKSTLPLERRAARFFLINRTSYSGLGDSGNMTIDQLMDFNEKDILKMYEMSKLLGRVEINNVSYEKTIEGVDEKNGFIFLDPPYFQQSNQGSGKSSLYGGRGKANSTHDQFPHEAYRDLIVSLKTKWLMTYDDSIAVRKLYNRPGIDITPFKLKYTLAGDRCATDALAGEELLISNYLKSSGEQDEVEDF